MNYEEIFTVDNLIKAYEETGIKPMYRSFIKRNGECIYGCALTVLTVYNMEDFKNVSKNIEKLEFNVIEKAKEILNLPEEFHGMAFIFGFDKADVTKLINKEEYKLGKKLREEFEEKYNGIILNGSEL